MLPALHSQQQASFSGEAGWHLQMVWIHRQTSDQRSNGDHPLCLQTTRSPRSSEPLAVQFIQAICQLLCLLKSFTALLPAWGYLLLPIISPCNGSCHGSNGVCVSTQRDTVDDGPLQVAVVIRNIWVSFHTAQEGVNCSRDRPQSGNAIACQQNQSSSVLQNTWVFLPTEEPFSLLTTTSIASYFQYQYH